MNEPKTVGDDIPSSQLLATFVALLQQESVNHIEFEFYVKGSEEIARIRVELLSPRPRRIS